MSAEISQATIVCHRCYGRHQVAPQKNRLDYPPYCPPCVAEIRALFNWREQQPELPFD